MPDSHNSNINRRDVLRALLGAGSTTALAGCNTDETTEDETTVNNTDTAETETDTREKRFEEEITQLETSFQKVYEQTLEGKQILTENEKQQVQKEDNIASQTQKAAEIAIDKNEVWSGNVGKPVKEILYNQLDHNVDEVFLNNIEFQGGPTQHYFQVLENKGEKKHLLKQNELLKQQEAQGEFVEDEYKENLQHMWNPKNTALKSPYDISTQREYIYDDIAAEWPPAKWLAGAMSFNILTDSLNVGLDKDEQVRDYWGKISISREASNILEAVCDHHQRQSFETEAKIIQKTSRYMEDIIPDDRQKPADEEKYLGIMTGKQIQQQKDKQEYQLTDFYHLTDIDLSNYQQINREDTVELYNAKTGYEKHKQHAYNNAIPDKHWPEQAYPGQVELKQRFQEDPLYTYKERDEEEN